MSYSRLTTALLTTTALVAVGTAQPLPAFSQVAPTTLPAGGSVAAGGVTIGAPQGNRLIIQQSTPTAIVNWQGFSIGSAARVDIQQPGADAAILNRVTGNTPSIIAGQLNANGQVYLVNPNGIAITRSGTVNTGSFVASTLGIGDDDFLAGRRSFQGNGASAGVSNAGTVTIGRGGYAALMGGKVSNSGTITVPLGKVGLGSGEQATLDLSGDGFLQVAVPTALAARGALVSNSGTLSAAGGSVQMSAATAREIARHAINMSGEIEATGVSGHSGSIVLSGGQGGAVQVSGTLDASSPKAGGGAVTVTGKSLALKGAVLDASGATGGGTVLVGGGRQGSGALLHADRVTVDRKSTIRADATVQGNGGSVVVWSDTSTSFAGDISARGGIQAGDGGQAEVSSKGLLAYTGLTDLRAAAGKTGTLLLDPENVTISSAADYDQSGFTASGDNSVINATTLLNALATANVTVSTGSSGSQAGNITVLAPLAWNSGSTLGLTAAGTIALNSAVTAGAGGLTLNAGGTITATGAVSVASFTLAAGNWVQNSGVLPGFAATDFELQGGSFLRVSGGAGTPANPYLLADIYGVQGIGSSGTLETGSYQLANDVDASGTANWNAGAGFAPVPLYGNFAGAGHTISGLTINRPSTTRSGLFSQIESGATVSNLVLAGVSVTGSAITGAIAGENAGTISGVSATGTVTGADDVGGIVGYNSGTITQSNAAGSVINSGGSAGGLVGQNGSGGSITQSHATNTITGGDPDGGLVGDNQASISQSYATGTVSGSGSLGGLVGANESNGAITQSYATGAVSGPSNPNEVGGFAGSNSGEITQSYETGAVTGNIYVGGFTGRNDAGSGYGGTISQSYSTGSVTGAFFTGGFTGYNTGNIAQAYTTSPVTGIAGSYATGGFVGDNDGAISQTYAAGSINGSSATGGFAGQIESGSTLTATYWDTQATGQSNGVGSGSSAGTTGLSTAQMQDITSFNTNYQGFDFTNIWSPPNQVGQNNGSSTAYYPQLYSLSPALAVTPASASRTYGNVNPTFDPNASAYAGLQSGDTVGTQGSISTVANPQSSVGGYAITQSGTTVTSGSGLTYRLVYVPGTLTVTQRAITVTADAQSRVYGDANPTLTYSVGGLGLVNGDTLSGTLSTTATPSSSTGTYGIAQGTLANSNYVITGYNAANLTVTQRSITVAADDQSRVYGDANPTLTYSVGGRGLANGDTLSGALATTATTASAVGSAAITQGNLTASSNYSLTGFSGATLSITQRPITITADAESRVYGDANPALTYSVGGRGLANSDTLSGSLTTAATTTSSVGNYAIAQGSLAASSNYLITGYNSANLTVTQRPITVTADAQSRIYGTANPALTYTIGGLGLTNGDTLSGALATTATSASAVGSATINQGSLTASSNYALTNYTAATLSITPRPISITADAQSRVYGDANPTLTYSVGGLGLINGDTLSGALSTSATATSSTGLYGIAQGTLANSNYSIIGYTSANLAVTPRSITVVADAQSRVYGDANPALTYSVGGRGLVNGDTLSGGLTTAATSASDVGSAAITQGNLTASSNYVLSGYTAATLSITPRPISIIADAETRAYGDANPQLTYGIGGLGLANGDTLSGSLTTAATTTSGVGTYAIAQGSLSASSNYLVTGYNSANLMVIQRPITVTADAQSRVYGDANSALTYSVGGRGLVDGDMLSGTLSTSATSTSDTGVYGISQGTLANNNYTITGFNSASLTVTQRPIAVVADAQSRVYGDPNPALTYTLGGRGLVNGDTLTGGLGTTATTASSVGAYGITQGSLVASSNYALSYAPANLSVTPRPLTVVADAEARVYGDANPTLTYSIGGRGLVSGDALSGGLATSATSASGVGIYGIAQGSLTAGTNYAVSYVPANLSISPRPITVTADPEARIYGDANPVLTYAVGGRGLANADTLSGALATSAGISSDVGNYPIAEGTLGNGNYAIVGYVSANLAVTPRPITVTADPQSRAYGVDNPALTYSVGGRGLVNGDSLSGGLATTATTASAVGPYGITQGSLAASGNYSLTYANASLSVVQLPATTAPVSSVATVAIDPLVVAKPALVTASPASTGIDLSDPVLTVQTTNIGSTVDRDRRVVDLPTEIAVPMALLTAGASAGVSPVNGLSLQPLLPLDPRFNGSVVCLGGSCPAPTGR